MEGFSRRESALLGFGPQRSFIKDHSSTSTQQRNSDIDFNDVFGGPPRRSSVHEIRFCYSEATENYAFRGDNGGTAASRNSWTGLSEKPVFGEEGFNRRRHNTSENFFNDIFKGNESLSSSPRKRDWDPYSSSPAGSRVLSPARPLPPQAEPFGTSLPAQFSLPAKLTKGMDLPTFGSAPRSPYKSKDGASNGTRSSYCLSQGHNEINDTRSYRQSLLSRELLSNIKESSDLTKHDETDIRGNLEREPNSLEVLASGNQFHFSIYKWASKGVPLAMPLRGGNSSRSRENSISDRGTSSVEWIASERELPTEMLHETKLPSNNGVSANTKSLTMQHDKQNSGTPDTSTQDRAERVQRVDPGNTTSHCTGQQTKSNSQSEIDLHCKSEKEASVVAEEAHKPELKPLYCLFYDNDYEQSNVEITEKAGEKERMVKNIKKLSVTPDVNKNGKKQNGRRASLDSAEVAKGSPQGPPMNSRDPGKIRLKGKVKEFVKIFNQEGLSKSKVNVDPSSQSSRWKHTVNFKAEEANFSETGADEKIHLSSGHVKTLSSDAPVMVNGNLPHSEKKQSAMNGNNRMTNGTSGRNDASSTGNSLKALVGDVDDSFQENFLAKELTQDKNRQQKVGNDPEELQVIDSKIRKWSNGKEGNIRSLLSTLQYVLWPESGWKTVPLVDIIDGHAVKRCYQKALLCLHPDKLQQNGATSRQKYIAEKVFDILQDAWTHFNSLGSL